MHGNLSDALEKEACRKLLAFCREFYADPKNQEAFDRWQRQQEKKTDVTTKSATPVSTI